MSHGRAARSNGETASVIVKRVRRCIRSSARLARKKPLQRGKERGEICERRVSPFRAGIAADMSATQQKKHKQRKHFILEKHHLQSKHPPSHCTTFQGIRTKNHSTSINSSRNSRPSFLIDDVRFWMLFSNMEHAPFTTPHTWHNRIWNNALKMKIRCQPKLCYSVAFFKLFDFKPYDPRPALPHLRKAVPTRKRRQRGQA